MWKSTTLSIARQPVRVRIGGTGAPLLLLHGAWAGAETHWGSVFDHFAARRRVIAPELPGIMEGQPLPSYAHYARWLLALLDGLRIYERVVCVGNSLGAAITTNLAAIAPERLSAIVLVNGGVRADRSLVVRILKRIPGGRRLIRLMIRYNAYSPRTITRAFADPRRAPADVVATVSRPHASQIDAVLRLFLAGELDVMPSVPTLVLWGRQDRLLGLSAAAGRRVAGDLRAQQFVVIDDAGHLPQVEQPAAFVDVVEGFLARLDGGPRIPAR